jgi:hypothetical protein
MTDPANKLRILIPEGSSTSAREAVTILGLAGHHVEICDPSPWCLARYSRFVRKFHRCPGLRSDPMGFLAYIEKLLAAKEFDAMLPTHEQGFLFARVQERFKDRVGLALPAFESYRAVHSKAGFSRLLDQLRLPQPPTRIVMSEAELCGAVRFPSVIKTSVGTASRGVWFVRDAADLNIALYDLGASDAFAGELLVQDLVVGATEKAQSVFCDGILIGFHAYRQVAPGASGGDAIKESIGRPEVRRYLETIGQRLRWHGALSVDTIVPIDSTVPLLIDCNPRLVEPMNGYCAGSDLVDQLLRVSLGETPAALPEGREGVRTHLAMQALLGYASRGGTRRDILGECWYLSKGSGPYTGSSEELTPVQLDWLSALPLAMTAALMLFSPNLAMTLVRAGFGPHLLDIESIKKIESEEFAGWPRRPGERRHS